MSNEFAKRMSDNASKNKDLQSASSYAPRYRRAEVAKSLPQRRERPKVPVDISSLPLCSAMHQYSCGQSNLKSKGGCGLRGHEALQIGSSAANNLMTIQRTPHELINIPILPEAIYDLVIKYNRHANYLHSDHDFIHALKILIDIKDFFLELETVGNLPDHQKFSKLVDDEIRYVKQRLGDQDHGGDPSSNATMESKTVPCVPVSFCDDPAGNYKEEDTEDEKICVETTCLLKKSN